MKKEIIILINNILTLKINSYLYINKYYIFRLLFRKLLNINIVNII